MPQSNYQTTSQVTAVDGQFGTTGSRIPENARFPPNPDTTIIGSSLIIGVAHWR